MKRAKKRKFDRSEGTLSMEEFLRLSEVDFTVFDEFARSIERLSGGLTQFREAMLACPTK